MLRLLLLLTLTDTNRRGASAWLAAALLSACGDGGALAGPQAGDHTVDDSTADPDSPPRDAGPESPGDAELEPPCDVLAVVRAKCQGCHAREPLFGAPMALETQADFLAPAPVTENERVVDVVATRIHDEASPMPPRDATPLTAQELATLDAWIAAGAPAAQAACDDDTPSEPDGPMFAPWPADCEQMYRIVSHDPSDPSKPMRVAAGSETHPQVIWDAPWGDDEVQIVAFRPITDNARVLHHWILYENTGALGEAAFITGWAPGNNDGERPLPADVGLYVPKGKASLRLDMHYNNVGTGAREEADMSGVEVCVTRKLRPNTATTFTDFSNIVGLIIPPTYMPHDIVGTCTVQAEVPIHVLGVNPHMHNLGVHAFMEVTRKDGSVEVWHDQPFDFEDQRIYPLEKTLHDGDTVKTVCTFVNDTGRVVTFGENTGNEMCFNFTSYYPMNAMSCSLFGAALP